MGRLDNYSRLQISNSAVGGVTTSTIVGRPGFRVRIVKHHGRGTGATGQVLSLNASDSENSSYNERKKAVAAGDDIAGEYSVEDGHPFGIGLDVVVQTTYAGGSSTGHTLDYYYERAELRGL